MCISNATRIFIEGDLPAIEISMFGGIKSRELFKS